MYRPLKQACSSRALVSDTGLTFFRRETNVAPLSQMPHGHTGSLKIPLKFFRFLANRHIAATPRRARTKENRRRGQKPTQKKGRRSRMEPPPATRACRALVRG